MVKDVTPDKNPNLSNEQQSMQTLKQYGSYIVMAIVVALGGYFGWTYWQNHGGRIDTNLANQFAKIQQTNDELNKLVEQDNLSDAEKKKLAEDTAKLQKDINSFTQANSDNIYAWQALMLQAKQQSDVDDYKKAVETLKQATQIQLDDEGLKSIANLRYAQALLANKQIPEAEAVLKTEMPKAFDASKQELLGDIAIAKNNKTGAIEHYQKAWQAIEQRNQEEDIKEDRALLRMKMEGLGLAPKEIDLDDGLVVKPQSDSVNIIQNSEKSDVAVNTNIQKDGKTTNTDEP